MAAPRMLVVPAAGSAQPLVRSWPPGVWRRPSASVPGLGGSRRSSGARRGAVQAGAVLGLRCIVTRASVLRRGGQEQEYLGDDLDEAGVMLQEQGTNLTSEEFKAAGEALQAKLENAITIEYTEQSEAAAHIYDDAATRQRKAAGLCLTNLRTQRSYQLYSSFAYDAGPVDDDAYHRFKTGDNAVLSTVLRGGERKTLDCVVGDVKAKSVQIVLKRDESLQLDELQACRWRLDQKAEDATYKRQLQAIKQLPVHWVGSRRAVMLRASLLGVHCSAELAEFPPRWAEDSGWRVAAQRVLLGIDGLNSTQRKAIAFALTRTVSLWQGPPGTGKTHTMLGLIEVLTTTAREDDEVLERMGQVLVVADTNAAVDNLLEGLLERGISAVRVGNPAKIREDLRWASLEGRAEASTRGKQAVTVRAESEELRAAADAGKAARPPMGAAEVRELRAESHKKWKLADMLMEDALRNALEGAQVVLCTCAGAASPTLKPHSFKVVLVDEATQATEPSALVPLMKGAECCVLTGDPKQLPPTVTSARAEAAGLTRTLFSRLETEANLPVFLLDMQYRMHPGINAFPSKSFYQGKVRSGVSPDQRPPLRGIPWASKYPVGMIAVKGRESSDSFGHSGGGRSFSNAQEARLAVAVANLVLRHNEDVGSVAILTPYNGQARLLKSLLKSLRRSVADKIRISSVDGFQGQEADMVVFTTVRSNETRSIGFVADPRRLNVAITRPRRGLLVICNPSTLEAGSRRWAQWLSFVAQRGTVLRPSDLGLKEVDR